MDANFFFYSIYDRFIQTTICMHAFVNVFFKKNFSSETIDWIFTKFHRIDLLKVLFTVTEKSGLWSDTGAQAPLVCPVHLW